MPEVLQFFACPIFLYVQVITPHVGACTHAQTSGQVPDVFLVQPLSEQAVLGMEKGLQLGRFGL